MTRECAARFLRIAVGTFLLGVAITKIRWTLLGGPSDGQARVLYLSAALIELCLCALLSWPRTAHAGLRITAGSFLGVGLAGILRVAIEGREVLEERCRCLGVADTRYSMALLLAGLVTALASLSLALVDSRDTSPAAARAATPTDPSTTTTGSVGARRCAYGAVRDQR